MTTTDASTAIDIFKGCVIDFDLHTGLSKTVPITDRHLSRLKGMFQDETEFNKMLESNDPIVYQFYNLPLPNDPGDLCFGCSILNPGKVGNEYFFTMGHYHEVVETSEVYYCLKGHGYILLENMEGEWSAHELTPGKMVYVPKGFAHRSINVSPDEQFVTFYVYRADAGHDYGTIKSKGFRKLLVEIDNKPTIIDNPRWKNCE